MTQPLLSLCIPTLNRIQSLRQVLDGILRQLAADKIPASLVEIIISDNCSSDETEETCVSYAQNYPDLIKYYRTEVSLTPARNFELALSYAHGNFLKLHNNNLEFSDGALRDILGILDKFKDEKPLIFFSNGNSRLAGNAFACNDLDGLLRVASYFITWIGGFGIWKSDFDSLNDFSRFAHLDLTQTDCLLRLGSQKKRKIICNQRFFFQRGTPRKSGYNIAEVFGKNYLSLLKPYVKNKSISEGTYRDEKKFLLINHIIPYHFSEHHDFDRSGFFSFLSDYKDDDYLYSAIEKILYERIDRLKK